ncbi:hypothetical protein MNBD_GAMMA08-1981 [hydrothermal vent metagenome]|uniref:Uncharacterized protein n=1 Tax=hydrothermal vent metagenome TaxID=652676 RepID=A0A3B0XP55_9ZZZZ
MAELDDKIPTLSDIVCPGDEAMLNHFDAHLFEEETEADNDTISFENASELENLTEIENVIELEDTEPNEIPSIQIDDDEEANIASEHFSGIIQSIANSSNEEIESKKIEIDADELKKKINQAISEALPGIEAQLKGKLYSKFGI